MCNIFSGGDTAVHRLCDDEIINCQELSQIGQPIGNDRWLHLHADLDADLDADADVRIVCCRGDR